jgi:hypothetical protein
VVRCDKTFSGDFDFAPRELSGSAPTRTFWYPGASRTGGRDGVVLGVEPAMSEPWIGMFADGSLTDARWWAVALPDRASLAVVCGGAAYRVCAEDPEDWNEISSVVVRDPVVLPALNLVLFVDFTGITAYGPDGRAWDTGGLVYDDLEIERVVGHVLHAAGSAPPGTTRRFSLDLRDGTSQDAPLSR